MKTSVFEIIKLFNLFAIVSTLQKKFQFFFKIDDFNMNRSKQIYFQIRNLFYAEYKKIERILLAFEICFQKEKNA